MTTRNNLRLPVRNVQVENYLSLTNVDVKLGKLNVLVGPNGGGKSNFLSVFRFLGEVARTDLGPAVETMFGGPSELVSRSAQQTAKVKISISGEITAYSGVNAPDEYTLQFQVIRARQVNAYFRQETILLKRKGGSGRRITLKGEKLEFFTVLKSARKPTLAAPKRERINKDTSALSVLRRIGEASDTKQVSELAEVFEALRLFDPDVAKARQPSPILTDGYLRSDASNLSMVLKNLSVDYPDIFSGLEHDMETVLPGFEHFEINVGDQGDVVQVSLREKGLRGLTPLARASFGTVRAISLFAMLRDPSPPRLTCLEEVDHGLHPHALDVLVDRVREASERTQVIIATHSPALVNRLNAEELIVFERDTSGASCVFQPETEQIEEMKKVSGFELGELWFSGLLSETFGK